jgi:alpha-1,2-mannosyltransferase
VSSSTRDSTSWRLRVYPLAILAALACALLVAAIRYNVDDPEARLGGDYPSFYGAGSIVAAGDWSELYDAERQQAEQAGLIDNEGGYLYFSYPPFVAAVYGLLALPGYQWSFLIHTLLMAAALAGAVWAVWPWLRRFGLPGRAVFVVALAFQPVFTGVIGGQNVALTLLLLTLAARLDHEDRPFLAGLVGAVLLFKPQFGVVVLPFLVVGRRWRTLAGWATGAIVLYAISTALMGGSWIGEWWRQARAFAELNVSANGANFISFPGFLENALGAGSVVAAVIGYGAAALVALAALREWWRRPRRDALWRWALLGGIAMATAPQTLFYDAGLLLPVLVVVLPSWRRPLPAVAALVIVSWLQVGKETLGWSPLGPLVLAALVLLVLQGRPTEIGVA